MGLFCVFIITKKRERDKKPQSIVRDKYGGRYFAMDRVIKLDNRKVGLCLIKKI